MKARVKPLRLTLLRHGRSLADDEEVHEGRYDSPLTEVGVRQARLLGAYWQTHAPGFERIISSSLRRAFTTAQILGRALDCPVEDDGCWMEFDNGPLAGLPFAEAERRYPQPAFRGRYDRYTQDGGESVMSAFRRAGAGLETLIQSDHENLLVVAHGGILNVALRDLLGATRASFAFGDTAYAEVVVARDADHALLLSVNQQPHLKEEKGEVA